MEMFRRFSQHDFQRWTNVRLNQMTSPGGSIGFSHDDMGMDFRFTFMRGDVSHQRKHFDLFSNRDLFVILFAYLEEPHNHIDKCADRREMAGAEMLLPGEFLQAFRDFIARVEDERPRFLGAGVDDFRFHNLTWS